MQMWVDGGIGGTLRCMGSVLAVSPGAEYVATNTIAGLVGRATVRCESNGALAVLSKDIHQTLSFAMKGGKPSRLRISGSGDHVRFGNGLGEIMTRENLIVALYRYTTQVTNSTYSIQIADAEDRSSVKTVRINVTAPNAAIESMMCNIQNRVLVNYTMDGRIVLASGQAGRDGRYFVAGYDPNERAWWSFDGANWAKHDGRDENCLAVTGIEKLDAGSIAGTVLKNENLSVLPRGILYIGYGVGATTAAWNEMISNTRYRICDVLLAN